MDEWHWVLVGLGIWAFAALPLALIVGRVIRLGEDSMQFPELPIVSLARRARQR
jgi:hypothetical protein